MTPRCCRPEKSACGSSPTSRRSRPSPCSSSWHRVPGSSAQGRDSDPSTSDDPSPGRSELLYLTHCRTAPRPWMQTRRDSGARELRRLAVAVKERVVAQEGGLLTVRSWVLARRRGARPRRAGSCPPSWRGPGGCGQLAYGHDPKRTSLADGCLPDNRPPLVRIGQHLGVGVLASRRGTAGG